MPLISFHCPPHACLSLQLPLQLLVYRSTPTSCSSITTACDQAPSCSVPALMADEETLQLKIRNQARAQAGAGFAGGPS